MIHTRIQLDPTAEVTVRTADEDVEVCVFDDHGDGSLVVSMTRKQLASLVSRYGYLFK